jgi:hypothetical protein
MVLRSTLMKVMKEYRKVFLPIMIQSHDCALQFDERVSQGVSLQAGSEALRSLVTSLG